MNWRIKRVARITFSSLWSSWSILLLGVRDGTLCECPRVASSLCRQVARVLLIIVMPTHIISTLAQSAPREKAPK